jgi:hypothetical protein
MSSQENLVYKRFYDPEAKITSSEVGTFYVVNAGIIGGGCVATDDDIRLLANDKVVTPLILNSVLKSAGGGGLYPVDSTFQSLTTGKLTITDDILPYTVGGTGYGSYNPGDLLVGDLSSPGALTKLPVGQNGQILQVVDGTAKWYDSPLSNFVFAESSEVFPGTTVDNKLMSPVLTQIFLQSPPVIGYTAANDAIFKNITIDGLTSSTAYANSDEAIDYSNNNKILSPLALSYSLASPPKIGEVTPGDGSFKSLNTEYLTVDNPPWPVLTQYFANNDDVLARSATDRSLTPSNIMSLFSYPTVIGDGQPSSATFTDLAATNITTTNLTVTNPPWPTLETQYASDTDAINKTSNSVSLTPSNIPIFMNAPGTIGYTTAYDAKFKSVTMDNLTVTNPPWPTLSVLYATNTEAINPSITNKGLTPSNIPTIMASPGAIGSGNPGTGNFTTLYTQKITITNDVLKPSVGGTGITSYAKGDLLVASGSTSLTKLTTGSDGQFLQVSSGSPTGYTWTTLSGTVPEATTTTYGVSRYAASNDLATFSTKGVVTCDTLSSLFAAPPSIGLSQPPIAKVSNLTITGSLTMTNPITAPQGGTGLTSYSVGDILYANTSSSLTTLAKGTNSYILQMVSGLPKWQPPFSVSSASTSVQGIVQIASTIETTQYSDNTKAITPYDLSAAFGSPADIGNISPSNGTFTNLTATASLNLANNIVIKPINGGTGRGAYSLGDLLVGNNASSLSVLSKGTTGQVLQVNSNGTLGWGNSGGVGYASTSASGVVQLATDVQAIAESQDDVVITPSNLKAVLSSPGPIGDLSQNTGKFSDFECITFKLTGDTVKPNEGGTGIGSYNKGDILVATNSTTLTNLTVGNDGQFLLADSTQQAGVRWSSIALPTLYDSTDPPRYQTATSYTIGYSYCRNSANTGDISINSLRTIDLTAIGISGTTSGLTQSNVLSGTVTVSGTSVTHDSNLDLSTLFIPGDVITVSGIGSRRITSISGSSLVVEPAFSTNNSNRNYYRGGRAPGTLYYLYSLGHATTPGYVLSTRSVINNDAFVDIPAGYSTSNMRQLPYVFSTTAGTDFCYNTYTTEGYTSLIPFYSVDPNVLSTNFTTINLSSIIPKTSTLITVHVALKTPTSSGSSMDIGVTNAAYNTVCRISEAGRIEQTFTLPVDSFQSFVARLADGSTIGQITVQGYYVTLK